MLSATLVDTAGILENNDPIENEGVKGAREKLNEADIVVAVSDAREDDIVLDELIIDLQEAVNGAPIIATGSAAGEADGQDAARLLNLLRFAELRYKPEVGNGEIQWGGSWHWPAVQKSSSSRRPADQEESTIAQNGLRDDPPRYGRKVLGTRKERRFSPEDGLQLFQLLDNSKSLKSEMVNRKCLTRCNNPTTHRPASWSACIAAIRHSEENDGKMSIGWNEALADGESEATIGASSNPSHYHQDRMLPNLKVFGS
ncbi:unnamed protein product, partial [Mesorhabditis spiculigera]